MESRMALPHGVHDHEHGPNNVGLHPEGEDEHRHEKKSVLKKVKDKAKKLKEKVLHGHGQNEHQEVHEPDGHDLYEEDDEEGAEMVEDPEVHGALRYVNVATCFNVYSLTTGYGSASFRSSTHGQGVRLGDPRTTTMQDHMASVPMKSSLLGQEEDELAPPKVLLERTDAIKEVPHAPGWRRIPHAPKDRLVDRAPSNYQTKVTDPTGSGGKEAGITPLLQSFDKMNIYDETRQGEKKNLSNQLPQFPLTPKRIPESGSDSESLDTLKLKEQPRGDIAEKPSNQRSHTGKISSATSAIADKEKGATNFIASKLGYIERDDNIPEHEVAQEGQNAAKPASSVEYGKKIAATVTEKLTPVYEKVVGLGSSVMSKVHGNTNTSTNTSNEAQNMIKGKDEGVSVKDYFAEKLSPGDEDRALSEVISETLNKGKAEAVIGKKDRPMGKVTESEEVKRRLGSSTEEYSGGRVESGSVHIPDKTVVDKLKDAVGSLFVKGEDSKASQQHALSSSNAGTEAHFFYLC
ncbi:hypothetical protein OIU84_007552 [Salix udensis]|uniref:Low-temperature-induced 65 kDa protein n=1 Tax=Salix udensis TaxID=889485 RepID=A0AAD6NZP4_9ROSI|nr:hypothetical protein OIU84_007552 [Salix udensis]